ncbi:AraC family transcriptional regulator [Bradyrhizobium sp. B097]|uniref:AraC family transcriptional regulator n=1 Tax=Bradyrhizobium sp. B097 TaxID=3140244 RepID=UPI00318465E8
MILREVIGRATVKFDLGPLTDDPFRADLVVQALPGLAIVSGASVNIRAARTRDLLGDRDDLVLKVFTSGTGVAAQGDREVTLRAGDALLMSAAETSMSATSSPSCFITIPLQRKAIASLVSRPEDALMRLLPGSDPLRLLVNYVRQLQTGARLTTYELQRAVVTHMYDLAALAIGATSDGAALAESRGLRAARLAAIKADISARLCDPDLSLSAVAARQRLPPRSVQRLFADQDTSFSEFVLEARLTSAHRLLTDRLWDERNISSIAFEAGFGDLSYFNRIFRRRYGATPSEIRAAARR